MRTNYRRIENILKRLGATERTNGITSLWHSDEGEKTCIRFVLVDGREASTQIGIHMTQIESEELESRIESALETAFRDGFQTVWIHQSPKDTKENRDWKRKPIDSWIKTFEKHNISSYNLDKTEFDLEKTLDELTYRQLDAVAALIVSAFHYGAHTTREHLKSLRQSDLKAVSNEK